MERVLSYINLNLDKKISLSEAAALSGYSIHHFCKKFKAYTGYKFTDYLTNRRMQISVIKMLKGSSITEIAVEAGYDTISGFEKAFKRTYGCSPREYIKRVKLNEKNYETYKKEKTALSERCARLKENFILNERYTEKYIGQYRYNYWKPVKADNNFAAAAMRLVSMINGHAAIVSDDELIVGYNYSSDKNYIIETYSWNDFSANLAAMYKFLNKGLLSKKQIDEIIAREPIDFPVYQELELKRDLQEMQERHRKLAGEKAALGKCTNYSHSLLGYDKVLKYGFSGILKYIRRHKSNAMVKQQKDFYEAAEMVCKACCGIGRRYAEEVKKLKTNCNDEKRAGELEKMYKILCNVPEKPAKNFHEAIQSLWFAHCINTWEDGINSNSFGRLDQMLYPYYKKDMESGELTSESAFELLCCLWLKMYREYDVQQVTIGGCGRDGQSAVNELSYMMLDVTEALGILKSLSLRFSSRTPEEFMRRALEVISRIKCGIPGLYNDDVIIDALIKKGVAVEDARDYGIIGYSEIGLPGKGNTHSVSIRCNLLKAVEYALNEGKSMMDESVCPGVKTLPANKLDSFEKLMYAVERQIKNIISSACEQMNDDIVISSGIYPCVYKSVLTDGCVEYGIDYTAGGAEYNYYHAMLIGVPNLADSLTAIEKLVYHDAVCTLEELIFELKNNFPNDSIHEKMLEAPKFGNGDGRVNSIANRILNFACDYIDTLEPTVGEGYFPQTFSFSWNIEYGEKTAATPDGRKRGEPLAYSINPMPGRDFNGVTGVFNSICSLPNIKIAGTTAASVEINAKLLNSNSIDYFLKLLLKAAGEGLSDIQLVVIDESMIEKAIYAPEKYADFAIKAFGRSRRLTNYDNDLREYFVNRAINRLV